VVVSGSRLVETVEMHGESHISMYPSSCIYAATQSSGFLQLALVPAVRSQGTMLQASSELIHWHGIPA